jgi:hypothetical protein
MATYEDLAQAINSAVSSISQCTSDLQTVHQTATTRLEEIMQGGGSGSGQQGATGETGADGKSAYELAVDNGFEGTEQEWLASLKGEDGVIGLDGQSGGNIDWSASTTVDRTSAAVNLNASNAYTARWDASATAPFDGACRIGINLPDAFTSSNLNEDTFIEVTVNGVIVDLLPVRIQGNIHTVYGIRKDDVIDAEVQYSKSISASKPDEFKFTFFPYEIQARDEYSTDEVKTNKVWIDGKAVYRKVFTFTMASDQQTHEYADLSGLGMDTLISIDGIVGSITAPHANLPVNYSTAVNGNFCATYINASNKLVQIFNNPVHYGAACTVVLEYTKS